MAIWKCGRCSKLFYDGGEIPICPACRASQAMLTALDENADGASDYGVPEGSIRIIGENVRGFVLQNAADASTIQSKILALQGKIDAGDAELKRNSEEVQREEKRSAEIQYSLKIDEAEKRLNEQRKERIEKAQEIGEEKQGHRILDYLGELISKRTGTIATVLYVIFSALFYAFYFYVASQSGMEGVDTTLNIGAILIVQLLCIPMYVVICIVGGTVFIRLIDWFYGFSRREKKIRESKSVFTGMSVEKINQYFNDQLSYLRSGSYPFNAEVLDLVKQTHARREQLNQQARDNTAQRTERLRAENEKQKRDIQNQILAEREQWIREVQEAALSYTHIFERAFHRNDGNSKDRGALYWLFYRFGGADGAVATARRGVGNLRITIGLAVDITDQNLHVEVTDSRGEQLLRNKELQNYYFDAANDRHLTNPAERMGYAIALMACLFYEAEGEFRRMNYDEAFQLSYYRSPDETGFGMEYEGNNYTR